MACVAISSISCRHRCFFVPLALFLTFKPVRLSTGRVVQVIETRKFALTPGLTGKELVQEAEMLKRVDHEYIIKLEDIFQVRLNPAFDFGKRACVALQQLSCNDSAAISANRSMPRFVTNSRMLCCFYPKVRWSKGSSNDATRPTNRTFA